MRWYMCDTDGWRSEGIARLRSKMGREWEARWYQLLQMVAEKMDKSDRCWLEYPIEDWCRFLECKHYKLISFLELITLELRTKVERNGNLIKISIPNLLTKRDNASKKSRKRADKVHSKDDMNAKAFNRVEMVETTASTPPASRPVVNSAFRQIVEDMNSGQNGNQPDYWHELPQLIESYEDIRVGFRKWTSSDDLKPKQKAAISRNVLTFKIGKDQRTPTATEICQAISEATWLRNEKCAAFGLHWLAKPENFHSLMFGEWQDQFNQNTPAPEKQTEQHCSYCGEDIPIEEFHSHVVKCMKS